MVALSYRIVHETELGRSNQEVSYQLVEILGVVLESFANE